MDSNDYLIQLRDLSFAYDSGHPLFDGLNLTLRQGEKKGLIGPNGSGKTTLFHLIMGLLKPTGGTVQIFGKPRRTEADFKEVRTRVGLQFQDSEDQLFSPTVAEDIAFGPQNLGKHHHEIMDIVAASLEAVGLNGYEERITYQLSAGEKRLVSLATVLAMEPEVLLLDEPTGGLDEESEKRVTEVIRSLPQSMIIISHDQELLRNTTAGCLRLAKGRLLEFTL